jgi:hypothetical protein
MTLRDDLLVTVDNARAIAGSSQLDQRPTQLTIRTRLWTGGAVDRGDPIDSDVVLPQRFTIKVLSPGQAERIFGSGGSYSPGEVVQAVITPPYPGCGWTRDDLVPPDQEQGTEILYVLSSNGRPSGLDGVYRRLGAWAHRPYRITLFLQRSNRSDEVRTP